MDSVVGGGHNIGEVVKVPAVSHTVVSSYLLTWNLLLSVFRQTSSERRVQYVRYIRRVNLVDQLMADLFRLLPSSPIVTVSNALITQPTSNKVYFSRQLLFTSRW